MLPKFWPPGKNHCLCSLSKEETYWPTHAKPDKRKIISFSPSITDESVSKLANCHSDSEVCKGMLAVVNQVKNRQCLCEQKKTTLFLGNIFVSADMIPKIKKPSYFCYDSHSVGKNKVALPHNPESRRSFSYIILTVSCKSRPKKFTMIPLFLIASATVLAWSGVAPQPWAKNIVGRDCICHKASHKPLLWTHLHCWYLLISCCDHLFGRCIHGEGLAVSLVSLWEEENLCLWCLLNFSQEASKLKRHFFTCQLINILLERRPWEAKRNQDNDQANQKG